MDEKKEFLLFVYGTLKKGFRYHYYLEKARFVSDAETVERYKMYGKNIPYVLEQFADNNPAVPIKGEVYRVPALEMMVIDELENGYRRKEIRVKLSTGVIVVALIYFGTRKYGNYIPGGEFRLL